MTEIKDRPAVFDDTRRTVIIFSDVSLFLYIIICYKSVIQDIVIRSISPLALFFLTPPVDIAFYRYHFINDQLDPVGSLIAEIRDHALHTPRTADVFRNDIPKLRGITEGFI